MKELHGYLIVALTILVATIIVVYHPGKPNKRHYELRIEDGIPWVFDPSTGQIYGLNKETPKWVALPKLPN